MSRSSTSDPASGIGDETGARFARNRALAVLRVRSRALAVAVLPAAVAVVLLAGGLTGHLRGSGWDAARWTVSACALVMLLLAAGVGAAITRAKPALSPTVAVGEKAAPDLYRLVKDLSERLGVPTPSAIALTPDCDSWLEDRAHPAHGPSGRRLLRRADSAADTEAVRGVAARTKRSAPVAPVLVIGSPFLWWMRISELRAVLAPVVAGSGAAAHPDIAAARRFVRGLDAVVALASRPGLGFIRRTVFGFLSGVARIMLRGCGNHAALMERGVATAASERAQAVDYGLRIVAQEQVGLAYAGWDRLLSRVALPAWRMGRWPSRLDAGVVSALTELSRRDRLADGFTSRLDERPACDLLEEPGAIDEAASLLAARLFHGGPAEAGSDWSPVQWQNYPEEVVDRKWRTEAARLHRVLDDLGVRHPAGPSGPMGPTLDRVMDHLSRRGGLPAEPPAERSATGPDRWLDGSDSPDGRTADTGTRDAGTRDSSTRDTGTRDTGMRDTGTPDSSGPETTESLETTETTVGVGAADSSPPAIDTTVPPNARTVGGEWSVEPPLDAGQSVEPPFDAERVGSQAVGTADREGMAKDTGENAVARGMLADRDARMGFPQDDTAADALAACISAELEREAAASKSGTAAVGGRAAYTADSLPLVPLQPPRTGRDLLADHVTAMVCCSAVDTAGAAPGLDWLDGPTLLLRGERRADLSGPVLSLVEDGDAQPLRSWLATLGVRPEKPVRLV